MKRDERNVHYIPVHWLKIGYFIIVFCEGCTQKNDKGERSIYLLDPQPFWSSTFPGPKDNGVPPLDERLVVVEEDDDTLILYLRKKST